MNVASTQLKVGACTIVANNYVPRASVLARSFEQFHPEIELHTVIIDHPHLAKDLKIRNSKVISIDDVDLKNQDFRQQATIYDVTEFATSIKPYVLEQLLSRYDVVLYFDPDTKLFSRIDDLIQNTFENGWSITPHVSKAYLDRGLGPSEKELMGAGIYNLGYIGVCSNSLPMLQWWQKRLDRDAIVDQENQLFTDQRWIDLAVSIFKPYVESGSQFNVAYWNLDHRELTRNKDGEYLVDGANLAFFHFSGFDPDVPHLMCRYQHDTPRVSLSHNPLYYDLFEEYRSEIKQFESEYGLLPPYGWGDCAPGVPLKRHVRRLVRAELIAAEKGQCVFPPSPFKPNEVNQFFDWLHKPSPIDHRPIPRHALAKLMSLPHDNARLRDMHLMSVVSDYERWFENDLLQNESLSRLIGTRLALHHEHHRYFTESTELVGGVDVVGYVRSELGVGESARRVVDSLQKVGVKVGVFPVPYPEKLATIDVNNQQLLEHTAVLLAVNADQVPHIAHYIPRTDKRRKVIGQWYWELETPPSWMADSFKFLDEVWVATEFMAKAVRSVAPPKFPVTVLPIPLRVDPYEEVTRDHLGLDDRFTFGFVFDFLSVMKRKNPIGLVKTFCEAFPREGDARLVIKTINSQSRPKEREELLWLSRNRSDIAIVSETWSHNEVLSFLKHVDCYVSMHRSEGLGLTIAEAMSQGTPVITTGYSGNMDFTTSENSYLIPFTMAKVGEGADSYDSSAEWAEPDTVTAVNLMRHVFQNRLQAIEVGRKGREDVNYQFSHEEVGERMRRRLSEIGSV